MVIDCGGIATWPVLCKTMTWDIEHMLDVENFSTNAYKQTNVTQEVSFHKLEICGRLNKWEIHQLPYECLGRNQ